ICELGIRRASSTLDATAREPPSRNRPKSGFSSTLTNIVSEISMTWVRRPRPASLRPGIDDTSTIDGAKWAAVFVSKVTLFVVFSALDAIAAEWLHEVIAAGGVLAERRAAVGVVLVAVVAGLVRAYEPVTAACERAGVEAFVSVV